jgi:SurA N-terminal domain
MNRILSIILSIILLSSSSSVLADRIVAIVEDTSITMIELEQRKKLLGFFNNIKNLSGDQDAAYSKMVLNSMIDDQVLCEYAKNIGLKATEQEIDTFISNIEQNAKMPKGHLVSQIVGGLHLPLHELRNKMKVEILRSKVIREALSRNVSISQEDIESMVLATNFRDATLKLEVFTAKDHGKRTAASMARLPSKIPNCKSIKYIRYGHFADLTEMTVKISELSPAMQIIVKDLEIDEASDLIEEDPLKVVVLCEKTLDKFSAEDNNSVANFLGNKKLHIKAQKFFQDLRKKTYVKILM